MVANRPPLALSQVQTLGGVYSDALLNVRHPRWLARMRDRRSLHGGAGRRDGGRGRRIGTGRRDRRSGGWGSCARAVSLRPGTRQHARLQPQRTEAVHAAVHSRGRPRLCENSIALAQRARSGLKAAGTGNAVSQWLCTTQQSCWLPLRYGVFTQPRPKGDLRAASGMSGAGGWLMLLSSSQVGRYAPIAAICVARSASRKRTWPADNEMVVTGGNRTVRQPDRS